MESKPPKFGKISDSIVLNISEDGIITIKLVENRTLLSISPI